MSIEYVSRDEIEAHKAAMQRMVKDEKKEQEAINDKRKAAVKASDERRKMAIEAAQRAFNEAVTEAKEKADLELATIKKKGRKERAAMQRNFECLPLLRQVYNEAPDDVFELIVSKCKDRDELGWGRGGLNAFRLANKRCQQVVESCTTMLTNRLEDGPGSLLVPVIQRCRRIEAIRCESHNLRSLEGCPDELTRLGIGDAPHISDLSPLASCSRMKSLVIDDSSITDISVVSSMPLLGVFFCPKAPGRPSIKDLSPLSSCPLLKTVYIIGNRELKDLSPLSSCTALECLYITDCPLITSLAPLSSLENLKELYCWGIDPQTSLLPLVSFTRLKELQCYTHAVDLGELRRGRPDIVVMAVPPEEEDDEDYED